jgi:5-methylcytosine-specific restriction endonuclease McrA
MPKAYELPLPGEPFNPETFYLGALCKRGHDWEQGQTLRLQNNKNCVLCSRIDALDRQAKRRAADIEGFNAKQAAYMASRRALHGRESRSKYGLPHRFLEDNGFSNRDGKAVAELLANGATVQQIQETLPLQRWLRNATQPLSVAKLVYLEQRRYWKEDPVAELAHKRNWSVEIWRWKYMVNPDFRYYERQRNSEKKARNRQNHTVRLRQGALRQQFAAFDGNCCYCGSADRIVVDHFIPRSKGGPHVLTNLVPACHRCNTSKTDHDPTEWYQSQSFYSLKRWRLILKVLGKKDATLNQLTLL